VPAPPYNRLPYLYLATLAAGLISSVINKRAKA
jgi:hypothetical protein